ncbi:hypothetical protein [Schlesneria paludicola]|uniref:hypothetical protein n=1 Tax=Schlesneria paludicola TaxID=360056 RepID=UPI00058ED4EC|nr:hypothetical protein [Schlesneria paludicola]
MMKLNDPRLTLIAGLALVLPISGALGAQGVPVKAGRTLLSAQAQSTAAPVAAPGTPTPGAPTPIDAAAPTPSLAPTPIVPVPATTPSPPATGSGVTTAPMPLGTQPELAPTNRPPMGLHYGEQEYLDNLYKQDTRPLSPYSGGAAPGVNGVPLHGDGTPITSVPGVVDRFGIAPPPGTLGQTYKRRSRLLEDTKHPRVGVVEVYLPENVDVTAKGLKSKWTGKVWRLESDSLIPGIPHIYEIRASWGEGTEPQVRTVRLIMGRIVDLEF